MQEPPAVGRSNESDITLSHDVLSGGGEMGARMRAFDWATTPVGPVSAWSQSLKTAVHIILGSRYPMFVWWGRELTNFYNDAYIPVLGKRHPDALGQRASDVWAEVWDVLGPQADIVLKEGQATWNEARLLVMERNAYTEETYFTFSYSPAVDDAGNVGGVFCACTEDTGRVLSERRLATLRELAVETAEAKTAEEACAASARTLEKNQHDVPFALLYLLDGDGKRAWLAGAAGLAEGMPASPKEIVIGEGALESDRWPVCQVMSASQSRMVDDVWDRFGSLPGGPWPESPRRAMILPIGQPGQGTPRGFLIAGVSPRRFWDDPYRDFLHLVAGQVSTSVANARAYEQERKRAEALAEIDRAKTTFFSNVSHEFRTPLTLMIGPVEDLLAKTDGSLPLAQREQLDVVHRNSLRLLKLVNMLLDFSRIEAGRIQAAYEPTNLGAYTVEVASAFRSAVEKAGLRLIVECPSFSEPVYVDRDMWEKIVLNLLGNAFKFTLEGHIAVVLSHTGTSVELSVRDTGIGIPEHELPYVFERFHRVEGAKGRTLEGTGIGLALVQELVKLHGGAVRLESVHGQGSVFTVSVPLGRDHLPADRIGSARTPASTALGANPYVEEALRWLPDEEKTVEYLLSESRLDLHLPGALGALSSKARILLADDNADMRDYIRRLLSQRYSVEAVADGDAALAAVRRQPPDLILTDVMMPRLDGFGLLRELRADPETGTIPIILLSARAGEESRVEGLDAGADDYLIKPFSAREVMARVGAHLELARMRREAARRERELRMEAEALYHTVEQGEQRLREQFEELNTIYQTAPVGLCLIDTAMRYVRINKALAAMNGVPVGATVGRSIREVIPGFADVHEPLLRRVIDSKEPIVNVEVSGVMSPAPGMERVWITNYYPLTTADGSVSVISVVVQEITEQKRAQQSIRNLNQALILKVQDYEQAVRDLERSKVELEEKNRDLEQFHDVVVGRELKMMELERELERLTRKREP